jgi:flagellar biosynthesis protein FlhF
MQLKRYFAATVADALALVRAELGPDALVLSTRVAPSRGVRKFLGATGVEVTAAVERELSEDRLRRPSGRHAAAGSAPIADRIDAGRFEAALAREVTAIPKRSWPALGDGAGPGTSLASLRRALASQLTGLTAAEDDRAAIQVFVGPPGAGKTTTIAKIGAQARARRGERMSLLAADGYLLGATDQLKMYAGIIGSPFLVARSATDLERALAAAEPPVLVDTADPLTHGGESRELLAALGRHPGVRTHLVMPAGTPATDGERLLERYADAHPDRVVLTRVDEAESVSSLVNVLHERHIPISYLGTGPRVPQDLYRATSAMVAACVLGEDIATLENLR